MSHERLLDYLNQRRIIYRRLPISDKPTACFDWGYFYEDGTHECYDLFRSKAKITSYRSSCPPLVLLNIYYFIQLIISLRYQTFFNYHKGIYQPPC